MLNKRKLYFILILLFILKINCINIINKKVIKKDVNILNNDLSYALFEVEFDDDIYIHDPLACPNFNCTDLAKDIDCSCDYTDESDCPKTKGRDPSCQECPSTFEERIDNIVFRGDMCKGLGGASSTIIPNSSLRSNSNGSTTTTTTTATNNNNDDIYSSSSNNNNNNSSWVVLELDKELTFTIDKIMEFRYKANSKLCMGMFLKISPLKSYPMSYMGSVPSKDLIRFISGSSLKRNAIYNICPSDEWSKSEHFTYIKSYTTDTYYIYVEPQGVKTTFSIVLRSYQVPPDIAIPDEKKCTPLLSTHQCINEGENTFGESFDSNENHYYTFQVYQPSNYFFQFPSIFLGNFIYISDDENIKFPNKKNAKWLKEDSYENYLTLYLEPKSENEPLTIYLCVQTFNPTNYSFTITRNGVLFQSSLYSKSAQQGTLSLLSSSRFITPKGIFNLCIDHADCTPFSILYPRYDLNPLYPVPVTLYQYQADFDYNSINPPNDIILNNTFKSRSYQFAYLLSYSNIARGITKEYLSFQDVLFSKLEFLNTLSDSNKKPLNLIVDNFKEVQLNSCNYNQYKLTTDLIDSIEPNKTPTLDELNNWRYQIGLLEFNSNWIACSRKAYELLSFSTVVQNISTSTCKYSFKDERFEKDPCCNSTLHYYECCNPRFVQVETPKFKDINQDLVESQCNSYECTRSVLEEYGEYLSDDNICNVPIYQSTQIQLESYNALRSCKSIKLAHCSNNSECSQYSNNSECDLFTRKCLVDISIIDKKYVECVVNKLSPSVLYSFSNKSGSHLNLTEIINEKYNQHLAEDCISGGSFPTRTTYKYSTDVLYYGNYPITGCLDQSCLTRYDSSFDYQMSGWEFKPEFDISECSSFGFCPRLNCNDNLKYGISEFNTTNTCKQVCDSLSNNFCGYCSNNNESACYVLNSTTLLTKDECELKYSCLLKNGKYIEGLTKDECENSNNIGICSHPCSNECKSLIGSPICISKDSSMVSCLNNSGNSTSNQINFEWNSNYHFCQVTSLTDESNCKSNGFIWRNCSSKPIDECYGECYLKEIPCQTKEECLNNAGSCSDSFYFSRKNLYYYQDGMGKCVRKHTLVSPLGLVGCQNDENDSPNGCFSNFPIYLSKEECEKQPGYKWWSPSQTKQECLSQFGCRVLDQQSFTNLPFNYKFNEMNEDQCQSCYESFNVWTNKFNYTSATWFNGVYKQMKYYSNRNYIERKISKVFSYQSFYNDLKDSTGKVIANLYRSQTYCKKERNQNTLNSIVCSCSFNSNNSGSNSSDSYTHNSYDYNSLNYISNNGSHSSNNEKDYNNEEDNNKKCFVSSNPLLGLVRQCNGENSTLSFTYGKIKLSNHLVAVGCQIITTQQMSKKTFTSSIINSLTSNFVAYQKPDDLGVLNDNQAIIGTLLTDGIIIKSEYPLSQVKICFIFSENPQSHKYPVFDFAFIPPNNQSVATTTTTITMTAIATKPYPLEANVLEYNKNGTNYKCIIVDEVYSDSTYFLINRMKNWKHEEKQVFDSSTITLLYILAVLFLLTTLYGIYQMVFIVLQLRLEKKKFIMPHLLITVVTIFIFLRSVYFWQMPKGLLLASPVGDYVLVVLPTFLYFSAFTLILVLWFIIVFLVQTPKQPAILTKRLYTIVFFINVVIYVFFILIVIVYQFTKYKPNNDCGQRIIIQAKNSKSQITVSILYAVVQVVLSLVFSGSFVYLGSSIYLTMKRNNLNFNGRLHKIFILTIVCIFAFILHSIFILVLEVSAGKSNIALSFIGLLLTEILPAICIFYSYDQKTVLDENKKRIKKENSTISLSRKSNSSSTKKEINNNNNNNQNNNISNNINNINISNINNISSYNNNENNNDNNNNNDSNNIELNVD